MRTTNFLTINELGAVKLNGFNMVTDFVYVEMFHNDEYMVMMAYERSEKEYCIRINVNTDKTITDERFVELVRDNHLENCYFYEDVELEHYVSSKDKI